MASPSCTFSALLGNTTACGLCSDRSPGMHPLQWTIRGGSPQRGYPLQAGGI